MKKLLLSLSFLLASVFVYSQITFERTYGGSEYDEGYSVAQTVDGGYILAGYTKSFGAGGIDVYLIRTDLNGDTLWTKTVGGNRNDFAYSLAQTNNNDFVITGWTYSNGASDANVFLIKTDVNGDTLWTKAFGGLNYDGGYSVIQSSDGGYIIVGQTKSFGDGDWDVYLIKADTSGNMLWSKTFGGNKDDYGYSVAQTNDGGYILTGSTYDSLSVGGGGDLFLIRVNSDGDSLWSKTYGDVHYDCGRSVIRANNNGFVIVGNTESFGAGNSDVYLIKTNEFGDTLWTKTYGGLQDDFGCSVFQTSDSGFIITGAKYVSSSLGYNVYLIKTNSNGDTLWTKTFGGTGAYEWGYSVTQTSDEGYIIAGCFENQSTGNRDVYLIKTDEGGNVAGINDYSLPKDYGIIVYPNPTTGQMHIQIPKQFGQTKTLEVFDCVGQKQLEKTNDFTDVDISSLTGGLYFIVLTNKDNERQIIKIIKE